MTKISNFFGHLSTVNRHRAIVCRLCFKLGLYKQGLTHDLSKYSPVEFGPGVKYFQGNRSPIDAERKEKGYSLGWLHHKGVNRHHRQFWVIMKDRKMYSLEMPVNYVKEMCCDRIAACMVYQKDKYHPSSALEFLEQSEEKDLMNPNTYLLLKQYLTIVAENDLDTAMKKIREM